MTQDANSHLQSAAALFQKGNFEGALASSLAALNLSPGHPEGLHLKALSLGHLGNTDEAAVAFNEAATNHPQRHAVFSNLGNALRAAGRVEDAITAYRKAIDVDPQFVNAWYNLGVALKQAGETSEAEKAYRQALALNPKHAPALNNLGILLKRDADRNEAIEVFTAALRVQPNMVTSLVNRGAVYRRLGRTDEALVDHQRAVLLAPGHAEALYQLANSQSLAGLFSEAEKSFHRVLAITNDRIDAHRDLAKMLWEMGETNRYLAALDSAIKWQPSPELLVLRGELSFRAGNIDDTMAAAERAIVRQPGNSPAHRLRGRVFGAQGQLKDAVAAACKAHELDPDNFETRHDFAEALLRVGGFTDAIELLSGDAPREHMQKHIGLLWLAQRAVGLDEYKQLYDYDRFTTKMTIRTPDGFRSVEDFNVALTQAIVSIHKTTVQPIDQTLYGGTQSRGRLWDEPHPVIQLLKKALLDAAREFVGQLPDDPGHPFLARKTTDLTCAGAWSVVLSSGGGHVDHIHPDGWISGPYYVRVPDDMTGGEHAGCVRLGASPLAGLDLPAERWVTPEAGAVVMFPSYMWHGVSPFQSNSARITAPFDLVPVSRSG